MFTVVYHSADGTTDKIDVERGTSLMTAAVKNGVKGIVGECGGQAMCATCHVFVRDEYLESLSPISEDEDEMLECTAAERDPARSRLGCQISVSDHLPTIEVDIPTEQI